MRDRKEFDAELREVLGLKLYYTPPENIKMEVPCCIYTTEDIATSRADDSHYIRNIRYSLTIIHKDSKLDYGMKIMDAFPTSSFDRRFVSDGMYHDVFTIYD